MAEGRQPEGTFPAGAETRTRRSDHVAFDTVIVEERRIHVYARATILESIQKVNELRKTNLVYFFANKNSPTMPLIAPPM